MLNTPEFFFGRVAQDMCSDICQEVVDTIKESPLTPRVSGRMAEGYEVEDYDDGARIVNRVAPYWIDVEFGHDVVNENGQVVGHAPAEPHVRPAWEETRARHGAE